MTIVLFLYSQAFVSNNKSSVEAMPVLGKEVEIQTNEDSATAGKGGKIGVLVCVCVCMCVCVCAVCAVCVCVCSVCVCVCVCSVCVCSVCVCVQCVIVCLCVCVCVWMFVCVCVCHCVTIVAQHPFIYGQVFTNDKELQITNILSYSRPEMSVCLSVCRPKNDLISPDPL